MIKEKCASGQKCPSGHYAYRFRAADRKGNACGAGPNGGVYKGGWKFPVGGTHSTYTITFWWRPEAFGCHASSGGSGCAAIVLPQPKWQGMLGYYYSVNLLAMGKMQAGHASTAAYYLSRNKWVHLSLVVLGGKGAYFGINGGELHGLQTQNGWALGPYATVANYNSITKDGNTNTHYGRGDIDEFAMWDRALTQHELKEVYQACNNGKHMPV